MYILKKPNEKTFSHTLPAINNKKILGEYVCWLPSILHLIGLKSKLFCCYSHQNDECYSIICSKNNPMSGLPPVIVLPAESFKKFEKGFQKINMKYKTSKP